MSMVAKILIVLNLILAVAVMGAAGAYLQSAENWKKSYGDQKSKYDQDTKELNDRISKTQGSLDEANRAKAAAEQKRAEFEAQNRTLTENNTLLLKKIDDLVGSYQGISAELKDLKGNLEAARQANDKLQGERKAAEEAQRGALDAQNKAETEQKRLTDQVSNLTASLDGATKDKVNLADQLEASNTHLEMYKAKYGPIGLVAAPVKGQVLAADPAMDIYLISIGEKDQLKVADELTVFRGDQFIAVVVVDKVFADKASVVVKKVNGKPFKKGDIKQGDKVANVL
jgi:predicted  nucleic acid-binding Zn-ribbon protein